MPRHFTGIRLLLVFVAINTVMMLMLVTSMAGDTHWLTRVLPGEWGEGHSTGLWVFFSLVLLVNAVAVLLAGIFTVLSSMSDGDGYQRMVGRVILVVGAVFLVLAYGSVSLSFARAEPDGVLFLSGQAGQTTVVNKDVTREQFAWFTLDQLSSAVLLDAPEVYALRLSPLRNNPAAFLFTHFTFAFRAVMVIAALLLLASFLTGSARKTEKAEEAPAEAAPH